MKGLREMQRSFSAFVRGDHCADVAGIESNGFDPGQRLAIYRNNTMLGLTEALRSVYPVIDKLVGERFFNRLSHSYIRKHPPQSGCLLAFGDRFPDFLDEYEPAAGLPYLCDTARLEWLRHEVYFESEKPSLTPDKLADAPANRYGELRFSLHPAVRFLISRYPVLRIWQSNQTDPTGDELIDLAEGGCSLLVLRVGWEVEMLIIDWDQYRFLMGVKSGLSLNETASDILADQPGFDLMAVLQFCLSKSLFSGYFLN